MDAPFCIACVKNRLFDDNIIVSAVKLLLGFFDPLTEEEDNDQIGDTVHDQADTAKAHDGIKCPEGDDTAENDKERREKEQNEPPGLSRPETAEGVDQSCGAVGNDEDAEENGQKPLHRFGAKEKEETEERQGNGDKGRAPVKKRLACQMPDQEKEPASEQEDARHNAENFCGGVREEEKEQSDKDRQGGGKNAVPLVSL